MKLSIKTEVLQNLVTHAMKGASNNKMIPITGFMAIDLQDSVLTLTTTDAYNYFYVREYDVAGDDFHIVVQTELFSKLVTRMTCETVTLETDRTMLKVIGNGEYSIELPLNEDGEPVVYPKVLERDFDVVEERDINLSAIKLITTTAKTSLATTFEIPCYTGYYVGDNVIATDTYKLCGINMKLWNNASLVTPEMLDLVGSFVDEKVHIKVIDGALLFESKSCTVYGPLMDSIAEYQVDAVNGLLNTEFESSCVIGKDVLLQLLDRLSLFVGVYDKNGIYLTFTQDGLQVESKRSNSVEIIQYAESKNFKPFTCCIDIEMLMSQIKANTADRLHIEYGRDNAIKITDGNVTQIIALLEDERIA